MLGRTGPKSSYRVYLSIGGYLHGPVICGTPDSTPGSLESLNNGWVGKVETVLPPSGDEGLSGRYSPDKTHGTGAATAVVRYQQHSALHPLAPGSGQEISLCLFHNIASEQKGDIAITNAQYQGIII